MTGTINISVKTKFLVIIITSILFLSIVTLVGSIITINSISEDNISNYRNDVYTKTQQELQNYVQVTLKTIDSFYQRTSKEKIKQEVQGHLTEQMGLLFTILKEQYEENKKQMNQTELKKHLMQIVQSVRYGENGYFWINDLKGVMLMHPIMPELDNDNLYDWQDENGKKIFKAFVHVADAYNEGFVDYVWPKPSFEEPQEKVSLVKLFKPFGWVIGTGEYVEDVTHKLQEEAIKTISEIRYGKTGYFWINDTEPRMIMHPIQPELDGQYVGDMQDPEGQYLFQEFVTLTQNVQEGGIVKYLWPKPGHQEPQPKFSYVQQFKPWGWIIGTGAYVDDVEAKIEAMKKQTQRSINMVTIASAVIFIVVLVIISLITLAISTKSDNRRV